MSGTRVPPLSVVMPVHDGAPYLDAAIESILGQTWPDFELVILNDGSTDGTAGILRTWAARDDRVRLLHSATCLGLVESSDRVTRAARAPVCARMDADDVAHRDRLARQWAVLRDHPDVVLVGTLWEGIDAAGRWVRPRDRWPLLRRTGPPPFPHATMMFRRAAFVASGGYRGCGSFGEDLELCRRLAGHGRVVVLPEALHCYRLHAQSTMRRLLAPESSADLADLSRALGRVPVEGTAAPRPPAAAARASSAGRLAALYYVAASAVWSGERPRVPGRRDLVPGLPPPVPALKLALVLTAARLLGPRALRRAMQGAIWTRDQVAGRLLGVRDGVDWRPEESSRAIGTAGATEVVRLAPGDAPTRS